MFVKMWMTRDVLTTPATASLHDVIRLMTHHRIRRIPVVDPNQKLLGIIALSDIARTLPAGVDPVSASAADALADAGTARTAGDVMTAHPLTTTPDAPIEVAARLMRDRKIGGLPVVQDDKLVGLITESDIFSAFVELFEHAKGATRITFDVSKGEDVLPLIAELVKRHNVRVTNFVSLRHGERSMCAVQIAEGSVDALLEEVWKSSHRVLSVQRL